MTGWWQRFKARVQAEGPHVNWETELAVLATMKEQPKPVSDLIKDWKVFFAEYGPMGPNQDAEQDEFFATFTKRRRLAGDYRLTAPYGKELRSEEPS